MPRDNLTDLLTFATVAQEGSFTRAAKRLNMTQSALSHAVNNLEARLGLRLLNRSTRNLSTTAAGERLLNAVGPQFDELDAELLALAELRHRPAGKVRITAPVHAVETVLWPVLQRLLPDYPDIHVEVVTSDARTDIVAERFDAGIRVGEYVERDMIAVCIAPPMRMAVVGPPAYFADRSVPQRPEDLVGHQCIHLARASRGDLFPWEFERNGEEVAVQVGGQLALTSLHIIRHATLAGRGLAYLPEQEVLADLADGRLVRVLEEWCEPFPGYHLYYPSRRQPTSAFTILLDALRHHEQGF
ncbi:LysR family transcriptional regulator [Methylorubrum populi]|uniref:LysR family transcriptional regulator n=1 Tax=Methylobacterium radiotolerans TaxID=31998 RepID=A0ABU7TAF5_9HYPH